MRWNPVAVPVFLVFCFLLVWLDFLATIFSSHSALVLWSYYFRMRLQSVLSAWIFVCARAWWLSLRADYYQDTCAELNMSGNVVRATVQFENATNFAGFDQVIDKIFSFSLHYTTNNNNGCFGHDASRWLWRRFWVTDGRLHNTSWFLLFALVNSHFETCVWFQLRF